jgi:spectinomycin phosphotransferase
VLDLLAALHQSSTDALPPAMHRGLELPARAALETALHEIDRTWGAGPMAEATRAVLAAHAGEVSGWLATFDRLRAEVTDLDHDLVITHGEPHPANLIWSGGDVFMIDWDTVGLAVPERDLWMLDDGTQDGFARYVESTGRAIDSAALDLYRLTWTLADLASFLPYLRSARETTADTDKAWAAVNTYLV